MSFIARLFVTGIGSLNVPACKSGLLAISQRKFSGNNSPLPSSSLWYKYCDLLERRPLLTKSVTSFLISLTADIICQLGSGDRDDSANTTLSAEVIERIVSLDWHRIMKFSFLGGVLVGPTLHFWYGFLARIIPGTTLLASTKRLALDQLVFAPVFIPIFFSSTLMLEGRPNMIVSKIKSDWWSTLLANYVVWVPGHTLLSIPY